MEIPVSTKRAQGGSIMTKQLLRSVLVLGWIPTLMLMGGVRWFSPEPATAQERTPIKVTRFYTGEDGKTHAEEYDLPLGPLRGGLEGSEPVPVTSVQFRRFSPNYFNDWHTTSRRHYNITLAGEQELEIGDGTTIRLHPGHIVLFEDVDGQGHITRGVGSKERISLFLPLAEQ